MNDVAGIQPINGPWGATVAGPRNVSLERQVPDDWLTPETVVLMQMEVWPAQNWSLEHCKMISAVC